jgi:hypothetical protein
LAGEAGLSQPSFFINKANRLVAELESAGLLVLDSIMVSSLGTPDDRRNS